MKERFEPRAEEVAVYDQKYQGYVTMLQAMDASWRSLKTIQEGIEG